MEENTKNQESQENKKNEEIGQEEQYNTYDSDVNGIEFTETKGKIKDVINKAKGILESMRFKKFLESKGLSEEEYKDPTYLKDENLSKEFSEYKLDKDDPDVVKCFNDAKGELIAITAFRDDKINELYGNKESKEISEQKGKVQQLLEDVDDKIAELKNQEGKEEEIKKLEEIKQKIGDKKQKTGLFQKLDEAAKKQMSVRRIALEDFSLAMDEKVNGGKDMVLNDSKIKQTIGELDKDGQLIARSLNELSKDDDLDKEQEEAEKQEENKEEKAAAAPKGASIPADVAKAMQQMAGQPVVAAEDTVSEPKQPSYADILGYDPTNVLNYNSSMDILGVFMGNAESPIGTPMTDDLRIALLNSPEGAKIVQQALMKINSKEELGKYKFFDKLAKKYNSSKMNKKVMAMIEKQLPEHLKEKSDSINDKDKEKIQDDLKKYGVNINLKEDIESQLKNNFKDAKDINNLESGINSLSGIYDEKINELKDILKDKELSDEDRERYKEILDNTTNKKSILGDSIQKYVGMHKFKEIAKDATKGEINQNYMLNAQSTIKDISDDMPKKTFGGQDKVYSDVQKVERDVKEQEIIDKYNDLRISGKPIPEKLQEQFNNISYNDYAAIDNKNKNKNKNDEPSI